MKHHQSPQSPSSLVPRAPTISVISGGPLKQRLNIDCFVLIDNLMPITYGFVTDIGLHDCHFGFPSVSAPFQIWFTISSGWWFVVNSGDAIYDCSANIIYLHFNLFHSEYLHHVCLVHPVVVVVLLVGPFHVCILLLYLFFVISFASQYLLLISTDIAFILLSRSCLVAASCCSPACEFKYPARLPNWRQLKLVK